MNEIKKKREIIKYSKLFVKKKISPIRSGNISIRHKKGNEEGFLISPSGKKNIDLKVEDIVFVKMSGEAEKKKKPSSEWRFHQDIYRSSQCNAIVNAHSKFAVICSCLYKVIPAFHYMIALTEAKSIKVADYALFGSIKLSKNITKSIKNSKCCLISNHGQITIGSDLEKAFELSEEVELLCEYYYYCMLKKSPYIISNKEMDKVLEKIINYKS